MAMFTPTRIAGDLNWPRRSGRLVKLLHEWTPPHPPTPPHSRRTAHPSHLPTRSAKDPSSGLLSPRAQMELQGSGPDSSPPATYRRGLALSLSQDQPRDCCSSSSV